MISKAYTTDAADTRADRAADTTDTTVTRLSAHGQVKHTVSRTARRAAARGLSPPPPSTTPEGGPGEGQGVSITASAGEAATPPAPPAPRRTNAAAIRAARSLAAKVRAPVAPDEDDELMAELGAPPPPAPPPPTPPSAPASPEPADAAGQAQTAPSALAASVGFAAAPQPAPDPQAAWDFLIDTYGNDPVGFVKDVFGAIPDPWQEEFLTAVGRGERRISVRAGHGVGKSTACAWAVGWQLVIRYPQKTIVTAPTEGQLMNALFPEVRIWIAKLPPHIRELFELQSDRIFLRADKDGSFVSAKTSSAERPEAMAGVHCDEGWVMLVCDEASAIPETVYEAAAGSMSGWNCITILISNPTRNVGLFYQTHHNLKNTWYTIHISCLNSKRVAPDFVKQIIDTYGEDSNAYRIRVLGEFATSDDDVLIPAEWVDSAMKRDIVLNMLEQEKWGLDVARFGGDKCVLLKRRGTVVVDIKWWAHCDAMETVGRVMFEAKSSEPSEICVDSIGMGGPVADRLRELGLNVRDVNVSEAAAMNPQAAKLRDELWISTKDWLGSRAVRLPFHDELRQDLCAPTYGFTSQGKTKVEGKAEIKKRLRRSPDFADALCLTFAGEASLVGGRASKWITGKPLKRNLRGVV